LLAFDIFNPLDPSKHFISMSIMTEINGKFKAASAFMVLQKIQEPTDSGILYAMVMSMTCDARA
jgi:hypothetical protein